MDVILGPIFWLLKTVIGLYIWVVIIAVILNWLIQLNVINGQNQVVASVNDVLFRLTEPVFAWVRRYVPLISGIDLSPVIVILGFAVIRLMLVALATKIGL